MSDTIDTSKWTPEQKAAYEAALSEIAAEDQRLSELRESEEIKKNSPAALIAQAKAEAAKRKAEREKAEKEAKEDALWAELVAKHGEAHVARIRTVSGSIMIRGNSSKEILVLRKRLEAAKTDEAKITVAEIAFEDLVLYPSKSEFKALVDGFPGLWGTLYEARDAVNAGLVKEIEKKG